MDFIGEQLRRVLIVCGDCSAVAVDQSVCDVLMTWADAVVLPTAADDVRLVLHDAQCGAVRDRVVRFNGRGGHGSSQT
jgi:hypothetical protein